MFQKQAVFQEGPPGVKKVKEEDQSPYEEKTRIPPVEGGGPPTKQKTKVIKKGRINNRNKKGETKRRGSFKF